VPGTQETYLARGILVTYPGYPYHLSSFTPDNGVLIAKNKNLPEKGRLDTTPGYSCFTWVIDAHPEDMKVLDFKRADGSAVMRTVADYRQLNDALFHAGLDSGSHYEWEDTPNRLHFYVIDMHKDSQGVLSYTLGVRSLDWRPQPGAARGVTLATPAARALPAAPGFVSFTMKNTGVAPAGAAAGSTEAAPFLARDLYRLSVSVDRPGWTARLQSALTAVTFGASAPVPVYVARTAQGDRSATITLTATSESDPAKTATVKWTVSAGK
jgi:hypothetical protein